MLDGAKNFLELTESAEWEGFSPVAGRRPPGHRKSMARFIDLLENRRGDYSHTHIARIREAMGVPDFTTLFGDVLNREILAGFQTVPKRMRQLCRVRPINDFETVRRSKGEGLVQTLPKIPLSGEYLERKKVINHYTYSLDKYGALVGLTWDAFLRDVDGFFSDIVPSLIASAANTEERFLTELFFNANGPLDSYFAHGTRGRGAVQTTTLTATNLQAALADMSGSYSGYRIKDEPIANEPKFLLVGTGLRFTALQLLRASEYGRQYRAVNTTAEATIAEENLTLIVNPWIGPIVTSGTKATTTWALFSGNIDAAEFGYLKPAGDGPELFMKHPNATRIGGGDINAFDGSWLHDDIGFKIRLSIGGMTIDPIAGWASDGQ